MGKALAFTYVYITAPLALMGLAFVVQPEQHAATYLGLVAGGLAAGTVFIAVVVRLITVAFTRAGLPMLPPRATWREGLQLCLCHAMAIGAIVLFTRVGSEATDYLSHGTLTLALVSALAAITTAMDTWLSREVFGTRGHGTPGI